MSENEGILRMAAEQFLGKSVEDVQDTIIQVTSFFDIGSRSIPATPLVILIHICIWIY